MHLGFAQQLALYSWFSQEEAARGREEGKGEDMGACWWVGRREGIRERGEVMEAFWKGKEEMVG